MRVMDHEGDGSWRCCIMMVLDHEGDGSWGLWIMRVLDHEGDGSWGWWIMRVMDHEGDGSWGSWIMRVLDHEGDGSWGWWIMRVTMNCLTLIWSGSRYRFSDCKTNVAIYQLCEVRCDFLHSVTSRHTLVAFLNTIYLLEKRICFFH